MANPENWAPLMRPIELEQRTHQMTKHHSTYKVLNRFVGKALHTYDMIADGDRILVALSGGKDSLTMLWILSERLARIPIHYELTAVHIDPGFDDGFSDDLAAYCREQGYRYRIEHTDYGIRGHSSENRENPCFLCSRLRRKRLFEVASELGCKKIALGHNKDDLIETLFLNIFYAGEISTMVPTQSFFKGEYTIIRPLALVEKDIINRFSVKERFPDFVNPCPSAGKTKRQDVKEMLQTLYRSNKKIKGNIFRALRHVNTDYLLPR
jgi:tRNA 2-thiocytidine biosynthesis protein TtcA